MLSLFFFFLSARMYLGAKMSLSVRLTRCRLEDCGSVHGSTDGITFGIGKTDVLGEMHAAVL